MEALARCILQGLVWLASRESGVVASVREGIHRNCG